MQTLQQAMASLGMSVVRQGNGWRTEVTFPEDFPAFQGHFPGHPILPGVVQILVGCELSRNLRILVTRNENVPRHFFALARFLSAFGKGAAACQN